ncbi:hypothetical protein NEUTE2DRAFT_145907, partial [Neurospora tetrasperma FGSC 2509]
RPARIRRACTRGVNGRRLTVKVKEIRAARQDDVNLVGRYGHGFFAKQYLRRPTSFGYGRLTVWSRCTSRYIHITGYETLERHIFIWVLAGLPGFIFSTSLSPSSQCGRLRLSWALALPLQQRFGALIFRL